MSYVGSAPAPSQVQFSTLDAQSFNGDGSTLTFTLNRAVSLAASIEVTVNNVQQSPYDGSYTVNGTTTLTFSEAPSTGTSNIYVRFLDYPLASITPADGTVTAASLASGLAFSQWTTSGSNIYYNTGNVGIGTSSPGATLNVVENNASTTTTSGGTVTVFNSNGSGRSKILIQNSAQTASGSIYYDTGVGGLTLQGDNGAILQFNTSGANERMRIDTSGNVGINTSSPNGGAKLTVNGGILATSSFTSTSGSTAGIDYNNGSLRLFAVGTSGSTKGEYKFIAKGSDDSSSEVARINSSGYFKASNNGTYVSSTNIFHELVQSGGNQWNSIIGNSASSGTLYGVLLSYTGQSPNNTTSEFFRCEDTTNNKLSIYSSGTVTNRTGTYNSFSDLKLKQDVVDANSQWDDIKALRVVNYRLKDEVAADPNYPAYIGLIAQEVEQVSPGLVDECPDYETNEDGERVPTGESTKAVKYSILYMKAVKALQEAMQRIETLEAQNAAFEARIAALESNNGTV